MSEPLGNPSQVASAVPSVVADGPAAGCRALDLRVWGGIDVRLLPDRGFDCGAAWFGGVPLAWISPVGEHAPLSKSRGEDWLDAFGGGLLTTCGLRNVGVPSEGHGQHGEYSHQRARDVRTERTGHSLLAGATIAEGGALGPLFEVERSWETRIGEGLLTLSDRARNIGPAAEPAPLLYHVNIGYPLWGPGSTLEIGSRVVIPRDADSEAGLASWREAPEPEAGAPERVFEHELEPDGEGYARAALTSPGAGLELEIRWDASPGALPRMHQWVHPAEGIYVLGLEPANCSVLGRAADREAGRLPMLAPGEERTTRLEIRVREL